MNSSAARTCGRGKMSAPVVKMAGRCFYQLYKLSNSAGRLASGKTGIRQFSGAVVKNAAEPWRLLGAACVQRLAVISADQRPLEAKFSELMNQMELERSLMSDHELRLLDDKERLRRRQAVDYDSDEEEEADRDQDIVLTQDLEDAWEQRLKGFATQPRARGVVDARLERADRCLAEPLLLLTQQEVGSERLWMLPQTPWEAGETLKTTAQRALSATPDLQTVFLGNAPCGLYKYRMPRSVRDREGLTGVKVFFFKAVVSGPLPPPAPSSLWVRRSELKDYLKPSYLEKIRPFLLNL
ncbi:39S ribosomal protein L46, mitochondrial isoform X2 [Gadus macrocephalus]|uniref:39S ribosomal protein L46, mitochondrial isoform X2 n=1 Tax=Gadus macrocephalus TaxID=80720 RepID=UPI0028CB9908|nr:39S ribosomal protein L46, mitochondrial isoform X2 [Gadus macrocephalus]